MWRHEVGIVRKDAKAEAHAWGEEWRAAGRILEHHPPLYELGGYKDAAAFTKAELGVDVTTARAMIRVARHATDRDLQRYGVWRLDAAIGYLETEGPLPKNAPVHFDRVTIAGKALEDCTVGFIKAARRRALSGKTKRAGHAFRDAFERAFAKHAAFAHVHVAESSGATSFHAVPNASIRKFAEVILATKLPAKS